MKYHAVMRIDDDRWEKYPYSIIIYDENDNEIECHHRLYNESECLRYTNKYNIDYADIEKEFY